MGRCELIKVVWRKLRTPDWCRMGLCGVSICAGPLLAEVFARAAKDIAWELNKTDYIFRLMPGDLCVSLVYSDELRKIPYEEFITKMATIIFPKGDCPPKLYWRFSMLKSDIYCADDMAERFAVPMNVILACANEVGKEREVMIKTVGGAYYIIFGPIKRLDSPLFS